MKQKPTKPTTQNVKGDEIWIECLVECSIHKLDFELINGGTIILKFLKHFPQYPHFYAKSDEMLGIFRFFKKFAKEITKSDVI